MKTKVIVVGGGFAGVQLVKKLDESLFDVLLIDKINHHQFQPLFYQVATSQIEPSSISFPLRYIFKNKKNVQIRMAELLFVDAENNKIKTSIGSFEYDYLVLANGCKTNFFGNKNIEKHSLTLKSTYDAIKIRNHILSNFEKALSAKEFEKDSLLNIVIVGGGATGVELTGAFAEIKNKTLPKDYPRIDFSKCKISLIEGSGSTLNNMSEFAKRTSFDYLIKMDVNVSTNTFVTDYNGETLKLNDGSTIKSKTVIWTAGIIGNSVEGLDKELFTTENRINVNEINLVQGTKNIFAIGDIAFMKTSKYKNGHAQVANIAIAQAKLLATNLKQLIIGKNTQKYVYKDYGAMATVGRNKAIVDVSFIKLKGYFAWVIWMFLHLMLILITRNRMIIFIDWVWNYITMDSSLRLILNQNETEIHKNL